MVKEEKDMKELEEIMLADNKFADSDFDVTSDVSDGSSYDGFINFTDGFVDIKCTYVPKINEEPVFSNGKSKEQKARAENARMILDNLLEPNLEEFYDSKKEELEEEFPTFEEFENWYSNYTPYELNPTPSLFDGSHDALDPKHDKLVEDFEEFDYSYYAESPAFFGVMLKLYDESNWRNDNKNGKHLARLESYFNDDLGYGRERVGRWASMLGMESKDGSEIGNHTIYLEEFSYDNFDDLKSKLSERISDCYESLGF